MRIALTRGKEIMDVELDKNTDVSTLLNDNKCDKYDYLIAVACGTISGLIDAFLVGAPGESVLGSWTDTQVDNCVKAFAKMNGWKPREGKEDSVASAISHLENKFKVNYDQRHNGDVAGAVPNMSPRNHHMKSLAHSPSPIGLFFSILNQFTSTSAFLSNGQLVTINTETFELEGGNFVSKLFCGISNWIGHLMSDVAGSSGGRGGAGRGSGIVMLFYELFGACDFGSFDLNGNRQTLAKLATRAFESGYDLRFALTMAIPVVLCEVSIRLIWGIRQFFQYKKPLAECVPTLKHDDLRVMLLIGHGSLCLIDGVDAIIRSGGNPLGFFLHINLVGWCRLATLAIKEVCIRTGITTAMQDTLEAFKAVGLAVDEYLAELEKYDIETYKAESEEWQKLNLFLNSEKNEYELNMNLKIFLRNNGIALPWEETHDSFDSFMNDKTAVLKFS